MCLLKKTKKIKLERTQKVYANFYFNLIDFNIKLYIGFNTFDNKTMILDINNTK